MSTAGQNQQTLDLIAAVTAALGQQLGGVSDPQVQALIANFVQGLGATASQGTGPPPPDGGLAELIGIGDGAASGMGDAFTPPDPAAYDEAVTSERIRAVADLYYIYQHERVGVFRVVQKLKELFDAGAVNLSDGVGAFRLYQFDRKQVLRYTRKDRFQAYKRVFGYTSAKLPPAAKPNPEFHGLFVHFNSHVSRYFRDKRVSEVIQAGPQAQNFGSVATVRRSGLDLRSNVKKASYGHVNVMRFEVLQLLSEAFVMLGADDIRSLFGADDAWEVVEAVRKRYLKEKDVNVSQRIRMAEAGRDILRYAGDPSLLLTDRTSFETGLTLISDAAEDWVTSAQAIGLIKAADQPRAVKPTRSRLREQDFESLLME